MKEALPLDEGQELVGCVVLLGEGQREEPTQMLLHFFPLAAQNQLRDVAEIEVQFCLSHEADVILVSNSSAFNLHS